MAESTPRDRPGQDHVTLQRGKRQVTNCLAEITLSDVTGLITGDNVTVVVEDGSEYTGRVNGITNDPPASLGVILDGDVPLPGFIHVSIESDSDERLRLRQMSNPDGELIDRITLERTDAGSDERPRNPRAWTEIGVVEELALVEGPGSNR